MSSALLDASILRWIASLEPRHELVIRMAMRNRFSSVRADSAFTTRVEELREMFLPTQLAMILSDAKLVEDSLDDLLSTARSR
jgi:hypothetical protein